MSPIINFCIEVRPIRKIFACAQSGQRVVVRGEHMNFE